VGKAAIRPFWGVDSPDRQRYAAPVGRIDLSDDERRVLEALHVPWGAHYGHTTVLGVAKNAKLTTKEVGRDLQRLEAAECVQRLEDANFGEYWQLSAIGADALEAVS
jgi:RIO-like serine/threonine protein kinase